MTDSDVHSRWKGAGAELVQRIISGIVLAAIALGLGYLGGWPFTALVLVGGAIIGWEWVRLTQPGWAGVSMGVQLAVTCGAGIAATAGWRLEAVAGLAIGALLAFALAKEAHRRPWAGLGVLYAGLPVICLIVIRQDPVFGWPALLWLFLLVWATDTFAYISGRSIGGPKLAPKLSPKKTWSGLAGGVFAAMMVGLGTALWLGLASPVMLMIVSACAAIVAQIGDLAESSVKRKFNVKDASSLIPGHGGLLDRADGLIAASLFCTAIGWLRAGLDDAGTGILVWQ